jgi:hypothetical protein
MKRSRSRSAAASLHSKVLASRTSNSEHHVGSRVRCPDLALEKSRMSLMRRSSSWPLSAIIVAFWRCSASSGESSSRCVSPMTAFSGVRNSCEMVDTNWVCASGELVCGSCINGESGGGVRGVDEDAADVGSELEIDSTEDGELAPTRVVVVVVVIAASRDDLNRSTWLRRTAFSCRSRSSWSCRPEPAVSTDMAAAGRRAYRRRRRTCKQERGVL